MSQGFEGGTFALPSLHHVNLKTTHMQEMIDWYATTVGLTSVFQLQIYTASILVGSVISSVPTTIRV